MAHVLGFTGVDDKGQEGIELAFESALAGKAGLPAGSSRTVAATWSRTSSRSGMPQDGGSRPVHRQQDPVPRPRCPRAGDDRPQGQGRWRGGDRRQTGEILALANAPTYNPNNRVKLTGDQLRNRA